MSFAFCVSSVFFYKCLKFSLYRPLTSLVKFISSVLFFLMHLNLSLGILFVSAFI